MTINKLQNRVSVTKSIQFLFYSTDELNVCLSWDLVWLYLAVSRSENNK